MKNTMKQLEIKTNKRLLIVEYENFDDSQLDEKHKITLFHNGNILKFICKGSDLNEEVAEEFSKPVKSSHGEDGFINYLYESKEIVYSPAFVTALESFISAIEASGYHWGENPVKSPDEIVSFPQSGVVYDKSFKRFNESESRTFNPDKCIIFEIL